MGPLRLLTGSRVVGNLKRPTAAPVPRLADPGHAPQPAASPHLPPPPCPGHLPPAHSQLPGHKSSAPAGVVALCVDTVCSTARHAAAGAACLLCASSLALLPPTLPALAVEDMAVIRLPASQDPAIRSAQGTLLEAWTILGETFFDGDFNHHDWGKELQARMNAAYQAPAADVASAEMEHMLSDLGDPYTRRIPAAEYGDFRAAEEGEVVGVGLLIANEPADPVHPFLHILDTIKGGPAQSGGVQPGDEVVSIDGQSVEGWTVQHLSQALRGPVGTDVRVGLNRGQHNTSQQTVSTVPTAPDQSAQPQPIVKEVVLKRDRVLFSPLFATTLPLDGAAGRRVGYLRLIAFNGNAAADMRTAIQQLKASGAHSYILDLRGNSGGLVEASVDIARLWLDGQPAVFTVTGQTDDATQVVSVSSPGTALTADPLVVLVDENSASASEILSGALRDHHRAAIVGDHTTYGKGKIQAQFELHDGSLLLVTIAKYRTPGGTDIDLKGIHPDRTCAPPLLAGRAGPSPSPAQAAGTPGLDYAGFVPGLPAGPGSEAALAQQLTSDRCVVAAQRLLAEQGRQAAVGPTAARGGVAASVAPTGSKA